MSGGAAVKAGGGVEGDHPVCTTLSAKQGKAEKKLEEDRGYAPRAPSKGLGLDSPGAAGPLLLKSAGKARRDAVLFKKAALANG